MSNKNLMNKLHSDEGKQLVDRTNYITLFIDGLFISTLTAPNLAAKKFDCNLDSSFNKSETKVLLLLFNLKNRLYFPFYFIFKW